MKDIQEVSGGNLDHETIPRSSDEIGTLAGTFNKMTGALKVAHEQEIQQKKMEHQLAIAREIGDRQGEGSDLGNLGNAYDSLGRYAEAIAVEEERIRTASTPMEERMPSHSHHPISYTMSSG